MLLFCCNKAPGPYSLLSSSSRFQYWLLWLLFLACSFSLSSHGHHSMCLYSNFLPTLTGSLCDAHDGFRYAVNLAPVLGHSHGPSHPCSHSYYGKEGRAGVRPASVPVRQFSCSETGSSHCMRRGGLNSVLEVKRHGTCIGSVSREVVMVDHNRAVWGEWQHLWVGNSCRSHHLFPEHASVTQGAFKDSMTLLPWQPHSYTVAYGGQITFKPQE